eukprot:11193910-Lingulodinium_polyedra.AAC.1
MEMPRARSREDIPDEGSAFAGAHEQLRRERLREWATTHLLNHVDNYLNICPYQPARGFHMDSALSEFVLRFAQ